MKNKSLISMFALAAVLFASCKTELEPQPSTEVTTTETETVAPVSPEEVAPAGTEAEAATAVTTTTSQTSQSVQMPGTSAKPAATAPGMNPPHGQPNHRCDIAVGAPLSSPKAASTSAANPAGTSTVTKVQPQNTGSVPAMLSQPAEGAAPTAPGMNPPHGQPGHSCSVAVGAPLPK